MFYIYVYVCVHNPAKAATSVPMCFSNWDRRTKCAKKIFRQLETGFHNTIKGVGKIIWDFSLISFILYQFFGDLQIISTGISSV